jgi:Magnesium transporter NIPA
MLKERLQRLGVLGCLSCIVGSVVIVIHAPEERSPTSVQEIWDLATQPGKNNKLLSLPLTLLPVTLSLKFTQTKEGIEIQSIC